MSDNLKLIGASEEELKHPAVLEVLSEMNSAASDVTAAQVICRSVTPPADVPLQANQHGLEKYGLVLRRKTNIHDLFLQRIMVFGLVPSKKWIAEYKRNAKTKDEPVPERIIPETYMPSVFIFILAAPFAEIESAITCGEDAGFYAFMESIDQWISTRIPTDKTKEVWDSIQQSLAFLEKLDAGDKADAETVTKETGGVTVKKKRVRGSSPPTR